MANDIMDGLAKYIAKEILKQPNRSIKADDALITGGVIDSFHLVDLALFVEDTYGVVIDDQELNPETFDTLEELVGLIRARQA